MDRIEALKSILALKPDDLLARYGLAMEYSKAGDLEAAVAQFHDLIAIRADYSAAYFHCGQALERLGRLEEAAQSYRGGIEAATRTGDLHQRRELEAALDALGL